MPTSSCSSDGVSHLQHRPDLRQAVTATVREFVVQLEAHGDHEHAIFALPIPNDLTDRYADRDDDRFKSFDAMVRAFIYARVTGRSQAQLARDLDRWRDLRHGLGFDAHHVSRGTFSYAKRERFSGYVWQYIVKVSDRILRRAYELGVRPAFLAGHPREGSRGVDELRLKRFAVRRSRDVVFEAWETERADNACYSDLEHVRQCAYMAMASTGTPAGASRHRQANGRAMSANNHLRITKRYTYPDIVHAFKASAEAVYQAVRHRDAFTEPSVCAVDVTPYPYWGRPDANPTMARMVSGQREEKPGPYALKFATITTTGDSIPVILGAVPVQEESEWGGWTYPTHRQVQRLLSHAREFVSVRLLLMDREYDGLRVARSLTHEDVTFLTPLSSRRQHQEYHIEALRRMDEHVDVERWTLDVRGADGNLKETLLWKHLYVPSTEEGTRTTVFRTNDAWIDGDTAEGFASRYRERWAVENQYRTVKNEFLASTTTRTWRVRVFYFYLGCALQNAWRLADFYYQDAHPGLAYDGEVSLTAGEFVELAAQVLDDLL